MEPSFWVAIGIVDRFGGSILTRKQCTRRPARDLLFDLSASQTLNETLATFYERQATTSNNRATQSRFFGDESSKTG